MNAEKEKYDIFISYRRDGGEDLATLLEERLVRLGYKVFFDVESLRSGEFNVKLLDAIENSEDFLLVLPERALDRCIDPKDWVRQEIAHALKHNKNIIPVMKRNFSFPDTLPEEIDKVRYMNGVAASMDDFNSVVNRIVTKFLHSTPNDDNEELLISRANSGDLKAINELALCYEYGSTKITPNNRKTFMLYQQAAESKYLPAIYNMGDIYEKCSQNFTLISDYGIEMELIGKSKKDVMEELTDKAISLYSEAAENNYVPAIYKLGNIEEQRKETKKAFVYYMDAAEKNYPPAQNTVGYYYQNGIAVEKNMQLAAIWYQRAADAHYAPAIYNYAIMIRNTEPAKALNMLRRVAYGEKALPLAIYALGRMYEEMQDMRNAAECYKNAVDAGISAAEKDYDRCRLNLDKELLLND